MAIANKEKTARPSLAKKKKELIVIYIQNNKWQLSKRTWSQKKEKSATFVRCLQLWYVGKYKRELNVNTIFKTETLLLLKYTFEMR